MDSDVPESTMTDAAPAIRPVRRMPVWWFVLLSGFTAGIYYPIWFLRRLPALDGLAPHERVGRVLPVVALILIVASILVFPAGWLAREAGVYVVDSDVDDSFEFLYAAAEFFMLVACLRLRRALLVRYADTDERFSLLWTLVFGALYFQYRFNRMAPYSMTAP